MKAVEHAKAQCHSALLHLLAPQPGRSLPQKNRKERHCFGHDKRDSGSTADKAAQCKPLRTGRLRGPLRSV